MNTQTCQAKKVFSRFTSLLSLSIFPCFLPLFCILFLFSALLCTCHLWFKFLLESLGTKKRENGDGGGGGWMGGLLERIRFAQWGSVWLSVQKFQKSRNDIVLPSSHFFTIHSFFSISFSLALCMQHLPAVWRQKRWIVFISRAAVLNTSSVRLCIFPLFFSSSLLLSHPYYF